MTAAAWSAAAAWATFCVALAAAIFAGVQTLAAASDRRARQRPHVVVDLDRFDDHHGSVRLTVTNIGETTARDVRLVFKPPLLEPTPGDAMAEYVQRFTGRTWAYMPPRKVVDTMFVHLSGYPEDADRAWEVTVLCSDHRGRHQEAETTRIDLDDVAIRVAPETLTMHDLATDLRKVREWLGRLPVDSDGMNVVTATRDEVAGQRAAMRERQWLGRYRLTRQIEKQRNAAQPPQPRD